jgi:uncharacterized protein (TIGR02302 family)
MMSAPLPDTTNLYAMRRYAWPLVWLERAVPVWWRVGLLLLAWVAASLLQWHALVAPWLHVAGLLIFIVFLLLEIKRALMRHQSLTIAQVERWLEQRNQLPHRPFATLAAQPVNQPLSDAQKNLWRQHVASTQTLLQNLKIFWPKISLSDQDPYALRYAVPVLLLIGLVLVARDGGSVGTRLYASINPVVGVMPQQQKIIYDVWLTPPEYTGQSPIILAKAGDNVAPVGEIKIPAGSVVTARISGVNSTPRLRANKIWQEFSAATDSAYTITVTLTEGYEIALRKGWLTFARWPVAVQTDRVPTVAFVAPPDVTPRKTVRFDIKLDDDYSVTGLKAILTPAMSTAADSVAQVIIPTVEIDLPLPAAGVPYPATISSEQDLASQPLAGMPVSVVLQVTDAVGHTASSEAVVFTVPERSFMHPLAQALIAQRKKLLDTPDANRETAANVMATVARQPREYNGDPVVLLALRSGAVRLMLDHSPKAIPAVTLLLWQTALRIEEGALGEAAENLQAAQKALQVALERNASGEEVAALVERLQVALGQYLMTMARDLAQKQSISGGEAMFMAADSMVGLDQLLALTQELGDLAATGSREAAKQLLEQLQEITQNLHSGRHGLTSEQQAMLALVQNIKELLREQKTMIDRTFSATQENEAGKLANLGETLTLAQQTIRQKLTSLISELGARKAKIPDGMLQADQAMDAAMTELAQAAFKPALAFENEALIALQKLLDETRSELQSQLLLLPGGLQPGGDKRDPLGRPSLGQARDDGSVTIPDRLQTERARAILDELRNRAGDANRSRTEQDYIRRLLELF